MILDDYFMLRMDQSFFPASFSLMLALVTLWNFLFRTASS